MGQCGQFMVVDGVIAFGAESETHGNRETAAGESVFPM